MTNQITRHMDGFIPSDLLLEAARRNPQLAQRFIKNIAATHDLWQGSGARDSQLFRFLDKAGNGDRFMYDAQNGTNRPGVLVRKEGDAPATDKVINDGYDHHGIIRDFYKVWHGRNSIDANGMAMKGIVHFDKDYNNAFWDSMYMTYGDGDGIIFQTFMLLNIAAHEMTHGVTEHAVPGGIEYWGMWGAINEHLSDVGGANVESWFLKLVASAYHFLVGKGIFVAAPAGSKDVLDALRSMRHPGTAFNSSRIGKDRQPAHMKDYVKTSSDNGGVHTNSGIPNGAYADFCDAIEKAGLGNDWSTTIGVAAKIWYAARPNLGNTPSFGQLAYWTQEACAIYPDMESRLRTLLIKAWDGRGVTADKNAIDDLTPARGPDDSDIGEHA
jgi:Zn-dependent metalloprotease